MKRYFVLLVIAVNASINLTITKIKKWIPDAVQTSCGKCNDQQKKMVAVVIIAIQEKLADDWAKLFKEYNPDGKFDAQLKEFLDQYGK